MALIPPFFLDCVVAFGVDDGGQRRWVASGFFYAHHRSDRGDGTHDYNLYVVTNRHVLDGRNQIFIRCNRDPAAPACEFEIKLTPSADPPIWLPHPNTSIDVAVIPTNAARLLAQGVTSKFFLSNFHIADIAKVRDVGLSEGDGVFVLGFPMGLAGTDRNFVIVRQGTLARIRDALARASAEYLVDASIFPGNSGGPVVTRPEFTSIQGTSRQDTAYLIGLVSHYIPYRDVAVSQQTLRPRIIFEENSGLASVVPIDFVRETIEEYMRRFPAAIPNPAPPPNPT